MDKRVCDCCGKVYGVASARYDVRVADGSASGYVYATICHTCKVWQPYGKDAKYIQVAR